MGPSNQPFITPILFTSAQSTIPSFPLGSWSSMPSATNPQAITLTPQSYQTPQATTNLLPSSQVTQTPATTLPHFQIQPPSYQTPSIPFPRFQFAPPPPPTNPLPPITNYFSMPLLGGIPPPPSTTNYLQIPSQMGAQPSYIGQNSQIPIHAPQAPRSFPQASQPSYTLPPQCHPFIQQPTSIPQSQSHIPYQQQIPQYMQQYVPPQP